MNASPILLTNSFAGFTRIYNMPGQPVRSDPRCWNQDNIPIRVQFDPKFPLPPFTKPKFVFPFSLGALGALA